MRAACMADPSCLPDVLRAFNFVIATYERKAAAQIAQTGRRRSKSLIQPRDPR